MSDNSTDTIPEAARLTADVVLFGERDGELHVLMILRDWDPYAGHWALPGGHVDVGEGTVVTARRELAEETGIRIGANLDLVGVYADVNRDPRGRYVTFAYTARLGHLPQPTAGDDAAEAKWMSVDEVLATGANIAFDHAQIVHDALRVAL